jgi:hypothetical protein
VSRSTPSAPTSPSYEPRGAVAFGTVRIGKGFLQGRLRWGIALAGSVALLVGAAAALGFGKFKAPQTYPAGGSAYPVQIADFNHDGKQDVVVGNEDDDNVSVLLGKGNGTLKATHNFPAGDYPFGIAVGDFNRDGDRDLAVVEYGNTEVSILHGDGHGAFDPPDGHEVVSDPYAIATGNFNGDNRKDLVVAGYGTGAVSILIGRASGDFKGAMDIPVNSSEASVAVGDFNRDGKQDVMALDYQDNVELLRGKGDGTFRDPLPFPSGTTGAYGLVVGDFNSDHRLDYAVASCDVNKVYVSLAKRHALAFNAPVGYHAGSCSYQPGKGDVNGDGNLDLLVSNDTSGTIDVLRGRPDGAFRNVLRFPATEGSNYSVAAGRLNADKGPDLAIPDYDNQKVAILLNKRR